LARRPTAPRRVAARPPPGPAALANSAPPDQQPLEMAAAASAASAAPAASTAPAAAEARDAARCLDRLYSSMQSIEGRLGGGEGVEGIYGSITRTGTQRVFDCLALNCGLGRGSTLVDIGAGLGRCARRGAERAFAPARPDASAGAAPRVEQRAAAASPARARTLFSGAAAGCAHAARPP